MLQPFLCFQDPEIPRLSCLFRASLNPDQHCMLSLTAILVTFRREYYSCVFSSSSPNLSLYPFTPVETQSHHFSSGYWIFLYQKVIWWCPSERLFEIASFILSPPAVPEFFQHSKNISFIRSLVIWFLVLMLPFGTMAGCHSVCCCRRAVLGNLCVSFSLSF